MIPGALDSQASAAWQAFFEVLRAGARAAHAFGEASLPMPLPLKQLIGMESHGNVEECVECEGTGTIELPVKHSNGVVPQSIRDRFPLGANLAAFGKTGKIVGYNDHPNGTHVLVDLGNGSPASFDPESPP